MAGAAYSRAEQSSAAPSNVSTVSNDRETYLWSDSLGVHTDRREARKMYI